MIFNFCLSYQPCDGHQYSFGKLMLHRFCVLFCATQAQRLTFPSGCMNLFLESSEHPTPNILGQ